MRKISVGNGSLVYSPDVRVLLSTREGYIEMSHDLIDGSVTRVVDGVSSFSCTFNNKNHKYTGVLQPMDRVIVLMKRFQWVQVFSGYLDQVPFFSLYSQTGTIKASCALKPLLYKYWDKGLQTSVNLLNTLTVAGTSKDSGLSTMLYNVLTKVGEWDPKRIHIQNVPPNFLEHSFKSDSVYDEDAAYDAIKEKLGFTGFAAGVSGNAVNGSLANVGAQLEGLSKEQSDNAWIIGQEAVTRGMGSKGTLIGIITALAESEMKNLSGGDKDSVGMFQQRPSQGWGSPAELVQPQISTKKFYDSFPKYAPNWKTQPEWTSAQAIQRSFDSSGNNYKSRMPKGQAIVAQMFKADGTLNVATGAAAETSGSGGAWQHPCPGATISSGWGNRSGGFHRGIDFAAPKGTPIYAVAAGTVIHAGTASGFGWFVGIKHADGTATGYGHMHGSTITVSVGQQVAQGTQIAQVDTQGQSTGPHLHFEVYTKGVAFQNHTDPAPVLKSHGVDPASGTKPVGGSMAPGAQNSVVDAGVPVYDDGVAMDKMKEIFGQSEEEVKGKLVEIDFLGNTVQVHQKARNAFVSVDAAIKSAGVTKANEVKTFEWTKLHATQANFSHHGFGTAIDIKVKGDGALGDAVMDPIIVNAFKSNNFSWGGDWGGSYFDSEHFQWKGGSIADSGIVASGEGQLVQKLADSVFGLIFPVQAAYNPLSDQLTGEAAPLNDDKLFPDILTINKASMRSLQSAPNGDFMSWFPDYFGLWNKNIGMVIEDIEIKDLNINWSDDQLATHYYALGDYSGVGAANPLINTGLLAMQASNSVASVNNKDMMHKVLGLTDARFSAEEIIQRYGIRPKKASFNPVIKDAEMEFFFSMYGFMESWTAQFQSSASFSFMPELYPGMRIEVSSAKVAFYVSGVTHNFSREGGFSTSPTLRSPSALDGGPIGLVKYQG